ncbi:glucan endo-1,3-beta-D-glucosidase [Yeosuana sp. MJ-SS3]|uniref:Glucan endo-1,3-beta-D-glucosidase n=1 Tax=Gilvirhabdus luticola TaxID=3079858 RepID=A0ABU3U5H5_9FLAO|nr:glucan endo-1,3-beta-D-glucosidase [Yeosuana sp. MJ-SS3]MDU8885662.1 glucan endo-1,3-beta-D-glucosidase [Yeosuana sp. MJ-SS3]
MKNFKYSIGFMLLIALIFTNCQEDDVSVGDLIVPSNIRVEVDIVGADAANPNGDGSGTVHFTATADNAISYQFYYNGITSSAPGGKQTYDFSILGLNNYEITVSAFGTGGISSTKTIEVTVLATYAPPADLVEMLNSNSSRTWRIKAEEAKHFGLGPVLGGTLSEWYGAGAFDKEGTGMYDDRYIFNVDGTFKHITNNENDGSGDDPTGTVFGREVLIEELGGAGGTPDGADILNYPLDDYTGQYTLTAPGGVETISLTGLGFIGYYTGGNHKYRIFSRSADEMILSTTDGNNEFEWWFILVPE